MCIQHTLYSKVFIVFLSDTINFTVLPKHQQMCIHLKNDLKITWGGYHVFRNTTWKNAKAGDKVKVMIETYKSSLDVGSYACAIKIKHRYYDAYLTVDHIPIEIYRYWFY